MKIQYLLLILTLSPLISYFIHALLIRLVRKKPYQLTAMLSVLLGNIPVIAVCSIYTSKPEMPIIEKTTAFIYSLIIYNALAYVYFHIFNMSETARRIHILIDLKEGERLTKKEILKRYNVEDIVDNRLNRLLSLKQLKLEDNKYRVNGYFLLIAAKIYNIWVQLLGIKSKEATLINY